MRWLEVGLCKEILYKINGKIKVEGEQGKGGIFTFSFPIEKWSK
jgi:K+-sensing histidine kinase KdpD